MEFKVLHRNVKGNFFNETSYNLSAWYASSSCSVCPILFKSWTLGPYKGVSKWNIGYITNDFLKKHCGKICQIDMKASSYNVDSSFSTSPWGHKRSIQFYIGMGWWWLKPPEKSTLIHCVICIRKYSLKQVQVCKKSGCSGSNWLQRSSTKN